MRFEWLTDPFRDGETSDGTVRREGLESGGGRHEGLTRERTRPGLKPWAEKPKPAKGADGGGSTA